MKKLLFFCCLVTCLFASAQSNDTTKYTPVNGYGYNYKRLKIDSSLMLALGDTTSKAPRQIKFVGNNIFYSDNAGVWHAMASGGGGGGIGISNIYTRGDSLFYTLNGSEYFINAYFSRDSADARYYSITNPAGYLTSAAIAGKLNYTDTALMLNPYLHKTDTSNMLAPYLKTAAGDARYPLLSGSYNNPAWLSGLGWAKLTGTPTTLGGYGITDAYSNTNPAGYITNSALSGYVPSSTTLTINGTAYDLSANRSWTVSGGLPSQTGNAGRYLTTDGSNASWGVVNNPAYYGSIYNKNSWSTVTDDFTANNITASVSATKISLTAAGSGISSLDYNYSSELEHWTNTAKIKATSTFAIVGVGVRSGATAMVYASINLSTGVLSLTNTDAGGTNLVVQSTSTTNLTISANDYVLISVERRVDTMYATARDITNGSSFITTSFGFKTDYSNGFTPPTSKYCVLALSGSTLLDSLSVVSTELVNPNLMVITDSKGTYAADSFKVSWVKQIGNYYNPLVVSIGPGEGVDNVLSRMPEILAINPKNVLLLIGRNNYATGMNSDTLHYRYQRIVTQMQAANINVYHMNGIYETSSNLAPYAAWLSSTFPTTTIDTYDPTSQVPNSVWANDGIHVSQLGNNLVATTVIQSGLLKNGYNYNDIVRFAAQPIPVYDPPYASATQDGVIKYETAWHNNQQLGTGMKTAMEIASLTNIATPWTTITPPYSAPDNVNWGEWNFYDGTNYTPFIGQPNSNLYLGVGAGNYSATGTRNIVLAGNSNTAQSLSTGHDNFVAGSGALMAEDIGHDNVVIGNGGAYRQQGGIDNVYIGTGVAANSYIISSSEASHNVFIGENAGAHYQVNGKYNVFIGSQAGSIEPATPQNKLAIGGGSSALYGIYGDFNNGTYQIGVNAGQSLLTSGIGLEIKGGGFLPTRAPSTSGMPTVDGSTYYDTVLHQLRIYTGKGYTTSTVGHAFFTPTTGTSVVVAPNTISIINPTGTLAALTFNLYSSSFANDDDKVYIVAEQAITSVSYFSGSGGTCVNCPTSLTQGQRLTLVYDKATDKWY